MICFFFVDQVDYLAYFKFTLTCFIVLFLFGLSTCVAVFNGQLTYTDIYGSTADLMKSYEENAAQNLRMDELQQTLHCCGSNNYTDWFPMHAKLCPKALNQCVPKSCCKNDLTDCVYRNLPRTWSGGKDEFSIYTQGCADRLAKMLRRNMNILAGFGVCVAFLNFCGLIITVCYRLDGTSFPGKSTVEERQDGAVPYRS